MNIELIDQIILAAVVILIWREWLKMRFEKMRSAKTLAKKLEQEKE